MPMIVTDPNRPDHPIVFANPAFLEMSGYDWDELVGRNCRIMQGPETDPDTIAELGYAIRHQRDTAVEILNYRKGGEPFWNALTMSPVFDRTGQVSHYLGSQLDITRRRQEAEATRQAQKMEAIGQLTGGIAHDFNNLLTVVQGFGDLVLRKLESGRDFDKAKAAEAMRAILHAAERGAGLTQQMLAFSRKQKLKGEVVDLAELVKDLTAVAEQTLGGGVALQIDPAAEASKARIDRAQAELAIINILVNARDAMPSGGHVTIITSSRRIEADASAGSELQPGPYAVLTIQDDGPGMTPDVLARAIEPFFSTK